MPLHKTCHLKLKRDLYYLAGLSLLLAAVIACGGRGWLHYLRVGLGLPFVLFFPGYTLIAALFPKKEDLDGIERVALSFGLSIAVVPLIGLALNYTPWGIRLTPILISLLAFISVMSGIALYRRRRLAEEECFYPSFEFEVPEPKEMALVDRLLSVLLIISILFAIGSLAYVITKPKVGERFTEFYILGMKGKADGYPRDLRVGEPGRVIVGVVNHEYRTIDYYVKIRMGGYVVAETGPIRLGNGRKWEQPMQFQAGQPHQNMKVEFLLYRKGDRRPYRDLHLWVNFHQP